MFFQYRSNSLIELVKELSEEIQKNKKKDPFSRPWIVVQNKETRQWLSLKIAELNGISANLEFILPSELIWKIYRQLKPDTPQILPFDRLPLQWRIFDLLINTEASELEKIKGLPVLSDETRLFHLSSQIADVFDLYQVYRPEMLAEWELGKTSTNDTDEFWQLWIWRKLTAKKYRHVKSRSNAFLELLDEINKVNLPNDLFIFGLSHFSKPFSELLKTISEHSQVHFFSEEWEVSGNDLFNTDWENLRQEWGSLKTDSLALISELENIKLTEGKTSFLDKISTSSKVDELFQIHSCHSPKREVEVLKDELLTLLENDSELKPEEILIMVPDMNEYAPIIKSIFSFNEGEPFIPVYAPISYQDDHQLTLMALLNLLSGSFKITSFIEFLELEPVRQKFDFSEDDLAFIRNQVIELHIHHGLSTDDSSYSLEKLMLSLVTGYITEPEDFELFSGYVPAEKVHGTESFELVSRLSECVRYLKTVSDDLKVKRTPQNWLKIITKWTEELFKGDRTRLISSLTHFSEATEIAEVETNVEFDLVRNWLINQFNDSQATSSGFGHGVVLSSYIPYRNIPFKVTAILGMNEATFPRNPARPTFDLINNAPKEGERITKKDDQLLFLEVLHSTEEHLYLSFLGQDEHSKNERLPSVFIQRMQDILITSEQKIEVKKEKLHGFHRDYFLTATSFSNSRKELAILNANEVTSETPFLEENDLPLKEFDDEIIQLEDLIAFFTQPCKWFSVNKLRINDGYSESEIEDREVFKIAGLDGYKLTAVIYEALDKGVPVEQVWEYSFSKGLIPIGIPGILSFRSNWTEVEELHRVVSEKSTSTVNEDVISIKVGGFEITGRIDGLFEDRIVQWRAGRERAKDLVRLWISHLVMNATSNTFQESIFISKEKGKIKTTQLNEIDESESILKDLIQWFIDAQTSKEHLCFFPESSKAYVESDLDPKKNDPLSEAYSQWDIAEFRPSEGADFYNSLIWRGSQPLDSEFFKILSYRFWNPFFNAKGKR